MINQTQYKAWGETRYSSGTNPSEYTYTGQYSYASDFGLHFYNARWYDSSLSRFAQADTIVPSGIQGYDRYAYANNSPISYIDPSGHVPVDCMEDGYCGLYKNLPPGTLIHRAKSNGIEIYGDGQDDLVDDIEAYMSTHPEYDPNKDFYLNNTHRPNQDDERLAFDLLRQNIGQSELKMQDYVQQCAKE